MKDKAIFAAEVAAVIVMIAIFQKQVMNIPVIGDYLPGFTARA